MTKTKTTKRALFASVLSLLLCVSMLIGSTFAWFTDTATTGVNKIQAGSLKIGFEMSSNGTDWTDAEGKKLSFTNKSGETDILWEPGATFELPYVRLVNKGDLALKFMLLINGIDGDSKLAEVLEVGVVNDNAFVALKESDGETAVTLASIATDADGVAHGVILPEGTDAANATGDTTVKYSQTYKIALHMKETAGNDYQGLSIDGMTFTALATQFTYENDTFGNTYDNTASYDEIIEQDFNEETGANLVYGVEKQANDNRRYVPFTISDKVIRGSAGVVLGENAGDDEGRANPDHPYLFDMKTEMNRVTVAGNSVYGWGGTSLRFGVLVFGTATLNDCTVIGTTANANAGGSYSADGYEAVDLGIFNYSKVDINGGYYGRIHQWANTRLEIYGAEVERIDTSVGIAELAGSPRCYLIVGDGAHVGIIDANNETGRYSNLDTKNGTDGSGGKHVRITIKSGATVDTLDLTGVGNESIITIEEGATVKAIVDQSNTYSSITDWTAAKSN